MNGGKSPAEGDANGNNYFHQSAIHGEIAEKLEAGRLDLRHLA
jgi:hypothetical protein